ncbi:ATP synthase subunit delta [Clostridium polyendosporum]|uniref:ATP synthase subunit delta n=1 Tax=Clostridium polyendosporum TaxID=69208 RepID=A0A919S0P9_9CLOT|nr:F0F1 ATP synthase subunit delta [Clostridium polyendosporum]GIM29677.1 ATP synthase subunit delta [Clostridium polyendosporum]
MYEYLDKRYALALYQVAEEKGKVEEYMQDLREICDLVDNNADFHEVIKHPQISTTKKKKLFINVFKDNIDEELLSFLLILIEKDRILYLKEKLNEMEKIHLERNNTLLAKVKSVIPLKKDQVEKLKENLEKRYDKNIILQQEIDKSIIGGLYVRVGNDVIDGTIKLKLDEMKALMLKRE